MTIRQVLDKNLNVIILDDCFRVFTIPYNFIVYTTGNVYLNVDSRGSYKKALQSIKDTTDKMPADIPEFLKTPWTFSQIISDDEIDQLSKFLDEVYCALE